MTQTDLVEAKPRLGRKRDHTRDPEILDAALDVLAETGYDGMTIDMVAARAKAGKATLYRRWSSKTELVLDAVACMKSSDLDLHVAARHREPARRPRRDGEDRPTSARANASSRSWPASCR